MTRKVLSIATLFALLVFPFANTTKHTSKLTCANIFLRGTATIAAMNVAIYTGYMLYRKIIKKESYSLREDLKVAKRVCNAIFSISNPQATKFEKLLAKEIIKNHKLLSYTLLISLTIEGIVISTGTILTIKERLEKIKSQESRISSLKNKQNKVEQDLKEIISILSENDHSERQDSEETQWTTNPLNDPKTKPIRQPQKKRKLPKKALAAHAKRRSKKTKKETRPVRLPINLIVMPSNHKPYRRIFDKSGKPVQSRERPNYTFRIDKF